MNIPWKRTFWGMTCQGQGHPSRSRVITFDQIEIDNWYLVNKCISCTRMFWVVTLYGQGHYSRSKVTFGVWATTLDPVEIKSWYLWCMRIFKAAYFKHVKVKVISQGQGSNEHNFWIIRGRDFIFKHACASHESTHFLIWHVQVNVKLQCQMSNT